MSESEVARLRRLLADAEQTERDERDAADAADAVGRVVRSAIADAVSLAAGADLAGLAGLSAPDLAAIVADAVQRVAPAAPERVAAIIAPDPEQTDPDPAPEQTDPRRTRTDPPRDWSRVPTGTIFDTRLNGCTGRVRVDHDGVNATFTATTGARGRFPTASRAVQSSCGNPISNAPSVIARGGSRIAPVNGYLAMTIPDPAHTGPGIPRRVRLADLAAVI